MGRICLRGLSGLGFTAMMFLVAAPAAVAQTGSVTGRVMDAQTGQLLAAAQVFIPDLDIGSLTQQNGSYLLVNVPAGQHTVSVQRIGYREETQAVTVGAGQTVSLEFRISQEALQLEEVIVTGTAGGTARRALGNSVEVLEASAITEQSTITNMQSLMAARTPGLRFGRTDGQVGGGSGITIRGVTSTLLGAQPLIYIDGVRVNNDATVGPNTGSSQNGSALTDLNPTDIERIEVIKGPSAASLYGTEASAGVIQIITKRGSVGAPEFEFEVSRGSNFLTDPAGKLGTFYTCRVPANQCPADQIYAYNMYDEANHYLRGTGRYAGLDPSTAGFNVNPTFVPNSGSEDLFTNGLTQRYGMSVRGGIDQVRYYAAASWLDETGVVDYNTNRQASGRANLTVLFGPNVNVDLSVGYSRGRTRFGTVDEEGGVWTQIQAAFGSNLPGVVVDNPATPHNENLGQSFLGFYVKFPEAYLDTDISRQYSRLTSSVTATHEFGGWFTQRLTFGLDRGEATNTEYIPGGQNFANAPQGSLNYGRPTDENFTLDYSANASYRVTEAFGTRTSVGAQYYARLHEELIVSGRDFPTPVQTVIDQTEFADRQLNFESIENKSIGFYVQEELNWRERLFLTGAIRADDNSAFGSEFDLVYYPRLSASWVLSEEPFWNVDFVNSLRLRGAWGKAGRQPDTFASTTIFGTIPGHDGNGLVPTTAGNIDVGPEVSEEIEVGFDFALLSDRVSGEFSYYTTTTRDMLVNQALAPSTGLTGSRQANLGEMKSWGWEASLDTRIYQSANVAFDLALAGDRSMNEVTSLGEDVLPNALFQVGWPFPNAPTPWYIRSASMNAAGTNLDPASVMCDGGRPAVQGGPNILPGGETIPCSAYNDPGILLGPRFPEFTFRVAPTLTLFNDLQVFALAEGQYGGWAQNIEAEYGCSIFRNCLAAVERTDPLWLAGRFRVGQPFDRRYASTYPTDMWKLRQLGMRYNLPADLVGRMGADRASFSVSANNVFLLWKKVETDLAGVSIGDPEYVNNGDSPQGVALWETPPLSSITATLRVTF